ncbi:hypothetical protein EV363DRAFT_1405216 [Boletus edulis]|nr:hypothetical protein EV363DRAFT_1405216 [Boletus edulis]
MVSRWELALSDANKLDPSLPWGYERKHPALHKAGDYENAANAFEVMLSRISRSTDPVAPSMTTIIDHTRIEHDRERNTLQDVWDAGLHWAWSDTCCINREDNFILQESLVTMFGWYQGSALTAVLLRGVHSPSQCDDLVRSRTLMRGHSESTMPRRPFGSTMRTGHYRNFDISNHKESPEILMELEEAMGVSTQAMTAIHNIWEKLRLDEAYSLLGVFSVSLPVIYGDEDQAPGRLLAQILTSSGDASILAWTGKPRSFGSCLPVRIRVFNVEMLMYWCLPMALTHHNDLINLDTQRREKINTHYVSTGSLNHQQTRRQCL